MTPTELEFYDRLVAAAPQYAVFSQVAMGGLIDPPRRLWGKWRERARWQYQAKIVDFVVYDRLAAQVWCLVELDDPSHDRKTEKDAHRDAMTREAGYVTLRWDAREMPSVEEIREGIETLEMNKPPDFLELVELPPTPRGTTRPAGHRRRYRQEEFSFKAAFIKFGLLMAVVLSLIAVVPKATQLLVESLVSSVARNNSVLTQPRRPAASPAKPAASVRAAPSATQVDVTPAVYQWWTAHRHTLRRTGHCASYGPWADELIVEEYPEAQMLESLNRLLADATAKACVDPFARRG